MASTHAVMQGRLTFDPFLRIYRWLFNANVVDKYIQM